MDFISGLIIGYLFTPIGLGLLLIFSLICSSRESNFWATLYLGTGVAAAVYLLDPPLIYLAYAAPVYFIVGLFWSVWRYKRYVSKKVQGAQSLSSLQRDYLLHDIAPKQMLGKFVSWVLTWPVSMIASAVGDLINGIEHVITNWLGGVYHSIFKQAEDAVRLMENREKGD